MELAGVDRETAEKAIAEHKEVWLAVDALIVKPVVGGEKYVPAKPLVDSGMTEEQEALCKRGRWLQDKINAVFSVAHSKTLHQLDDPPQVESVDLPQPDEQVHLPSPASSTSPQPDADEKTTQ